MADVGPVLVIGGTRGTGLIIARLLSNRGWPVRVVARDPKAASARLGAGIEVRRGDLTEPGTLPEVVEGAAHIVFTAGVRSGRPATERRVRATEYQGVVETLEAARALGFAGRFLYMTSSGVHTRSFLATALNLYKGNTLRWRAQAEEAIRATPFDYTIVRTGVLMNSPGGVRAVRVTQEGLKLGFRYRIARADVAQAFVAALDHPDTSRATFELVWDRGKRLRPWSDLLDGLRPDG